MNKINKKLSKKEEAKGGNLTLVLFLSFIVGLLFIYAPVSHYLGEWNKWWNNSVEVNIPNDDEYNSIYFKNCEVRTIYSGFTVHYAKNCQP